MADISFKERCPCGNYVEVSGYTAEVRLQIQNWRSIHNKHSNAMSKAIVQDRENRTYPPIIWPGGDSLTTTTTPTITYNTDTTTGIAKTE